MLNRLRIRIKGIAPHMQHNGQLADPLNRWSKAMKQITKKRTKTDDDLVELSRLEFMGGLYLDEKNEPCIPDHVVEGFFGSASKSLKMKREGAAGISSSGNWPLIYDGPRDPDEMWACGRFRDTRGAKLQGKKIQRTRPIFTSWALEFEVFYDTEIVSLDDIKMMLAKGMSTHGLGDYLPKFGRFVVEKIEELGPVSLAA